MFTCQIKSNNVFPMQKVSRAVFSRSAFTLLELLLAISLLSIVCMVTYMTFSTTLNAWKKATVMTDNLHHGDYVMEQLIMALRSMYVPESGSTGEYGFWHEDNGDDADSSDVISWVKIGSSFVGADCPFAGSPHRVRFSVEEDDDDNKVVAIKAWRLLGQPEDFDSEDVEPFEISKRITGFDCKVAYQIVDNEIEWLDEWEQTNRIPTAIEVTLFLEPTEKDGEPIEIKRIVGVPVGPASWSK